MSGVKTSGGWGCRKLCNFSTPSDLIPMGHEIKSKKAYPLRNHINFQLGNCWGTRNHWPCGLMVLGPQWLPRVLYMQFLTGIGSCYKSQFLWKILIVHGKLHVYLGTKRHQVRDLVPSGTGTRIEQGSAVVL